ncbi:putative glycosyl transferase, family 2 [Gordonia polyisoprenivorans VH2]|uniref:Putative glycosyl transferase, family 2 n=1 Tax=Gordonia polyisoprenivorans (strain DSM 44266 / VH2) TaxID=1112204 RepID=H6N1G8_GORPV|nr:putative glycosyl transferase, family 2 [Gordonia polyisoprenivorans VH2]
MPSISFVIVVYRNSAESIVSLVDVLQKGSDLAGYLCEVVVINNDAQDTLDFDGEANVRVLSGHGNIGFAAGTALGTSSSTGEILVFANPDIDPEVFAVANFVKKCVDDADSVHIPKLVDCEGKLDYAAYENWTFTPGRSSAAYLCRNKLFAGETTRVLPRYAKAPGAWVGMSRIAAERLIFVFDPDFFLYGEDRDFTDRVRRSGIRILAHSNISIPHAGGASSEGLGGLVSRCKADANLRIAYRRYGRAGALIEAADLVVHSITAYLRRRALAGSLLEARWSEIRRWWAARFTDPGPLNSTTATERPLTGLEGRA